MRNTVLAGVAAAAALTLLTAVPAVAELQTETTVTSHSVPADIVIGIPYDFDLWWDSSSFAPDGAVTFPLQAIEYDGTFVHDTFAMSTVAPEGCVRVVESFTFGYTLADYPPALEDEATVVGGIGTGDPLVFAPLAAGSVSHTGEGSAEIDPDRVYVDLTIYDTPQPQSGSLTLAYPAPVAPNEARGYIGFGPPDSVTWVVDNASFLVTDTCTSEVDVPVLDPEEEIPAVDTPTTTPAITKPVLADTGIDHGLAAVVATALLGTGAATVLLGQRRTRRI